MVLNLIEQALCFGLSRSGGNIVAGYALFVGDMVMSDDVVVLLYFGFHHFDNGAFLLGEGILVIILCCLFVQFHELPLILQSPDFVLNLFDFVAFG